MAALKRLVVVLTAACMVSAGCTYAEEEPGLFRNRATQSPTIENTQPPAPTNPHLPVAAEAEWTTAEGLKISTRFAIHAVRRIQGATVVDVTIPNYEDWNAAELTVLLYEFKDGLNRYLETSGAPQRSLESLIAFNKANAATVMPHFGQELFERAQAKGPLTESAYLKAKSEARRLAGTDGLLAALDRQRLDAIIAPSMSPAWPIDHVLGDHFIGGGGYGMAAIAGTPSITIPIGDSHGLPLGLTLMGRAYSEPQLLAMAYALEQATKARKPPGFKATLDTR